MDIGLRYCEGNVVGVCLWRRAARRRALPKMLIIIVNEPKFIYYSSYYTVESATPEGCTVEVCSDYKRDQISAFTHDS